MIKLKVKIWGQEIGQLAWEANTRRTYFVFNPEASDIPDIAPLLSPAKNRNMHLPIWGDDRPLYQGLPPFIADSLPDLWGNTLFDKWVKESKIPRNKITPLYKLMFTGIRGMGALEYEPYAEDLSHSRAINIKSLYDLSLKILDDRGNMALQPDEELTLQALLAVGTSAGGRQMKAVIAINEKSGEIRSGQTEALDGYDYYILKFGDRSMPVAEIEAAYHRMAIAAGIVMEECGLLPIEGVNHFLTKRFDRASGKKIHMQTLAAMNPDARSYEDLVATYRELSISEREIEQLFCRMAFNVMANNTDDHNKNFAFLLEENGKWRPAPAYDITFIFNANATGPNVERMLSIGGKTCEISKTDLLDFAKRNGIKNANAIITRVADAIKDFNRYATECGVPQPWRAIMQKALRDNLAAYGYIDKAEDENPTFIDKSGRKIEKFTVSVNSRSVLEVSAIINGRRHRKFIRPGNIFYADLMNQDIYCLPLDLKIRLVEDLFPVD